MIRNFYQYCSQRYKLFPE